MRVKLVRRRTKARRTTAASHTARGEAALEGTPQPQPGSIGSVGGVPLVDSELEPDAVEPDAVEPDEPAPPAPPNPPDPPDPPAPPVPLEPPSTPASGDGVQVPAWQVPSEHVVPSGFKGLVHAPVASQVPVSWQSSKAGQTTAAPAVQLPALQVSVWVQGSPSSHSEPSVLAGLEHTPVAGSQAPVTWH